MTARDKKHAIRLALETWPEKSATEMAEQIGVHQTYVSRLREEVKTSLNLPSRVTGKDGKSYPASRRPEREIPPSGVHRSASLESGAELVR